MKKDIKFFFFKQKTAYEMRISDWSSDVCSSDLQFTASGEPVPTTRPFERVYFDGTELRQIATLGDDLKVAGSKLKLVYGFDDYTQFAMPPVTFPGPYREEMRSEEHTSELQSLMRISYAVFCLKKKKSLTHPT